MARTGVHPAIQLRKGGGKRQASKKWIVSSLLSLVLAIAGVTIIFSTSRFQEHVKSDITIPTLRAASYSFAAECNPMAMPSLRPIQHRREIGNMLEEMGYKTGAEVGVQQGYFSKDILSRWNSCKSFHLVDLWAHQENYKDVANLPDANHNEFYQQAQDNLREWSFKTTFHRMYSTEAASRMEPNSLDFVYIDARHDYCGVTEDLEAYWPLLKPGGIMAGHDFLTAVEVWGQDWSVCLNGTVHKGAVKGAVLDFMGQHGISVSITTDTSEGAPSWLVQKALCRRV